MTRRALGAMLGSAVVCIAQDDAWSTFVRWLQDQPPNSRLVDFIESYRKHLVALGYSEDQVRQRMNVVGTSIFTRRKGVEVLWDKVYAGKDPIFLQTPSAVVVRAIEGRAPGSALDVGMGQGRNSVFLAAQGWSVTGFDPSTVAVRMATANSEKAGVAIDARVARDDEFDYGSARWDLIVVTYVRDLTARDADLYWAALRPGGAVPYENGADRGNEVLRAFFRFQIVHFEDKETTPEWNPQTKMRVQQMIAQKPR